MGSFECEIRAARRIHAGRPVHLHFRLAQRGHASVYVLDWHTPLEGLRSDDFHVVRDGHEVPYHGPMVKRGDPSASSYHELAPGAPLEADIDIALAYDFGVAGHYKVTFRGVLLDVIAHAAEIPRRRDAFQSVTVACAPITLEIAR